MKDLPDIISGYYDDIHNIYFTVPHIIDRPTHWITCPVLPATLSIAFSQLPIEHSIHIIQTQHQKGTHN